MGIDPERLDGPIVGIASTWTETMPCNLNLRRLADRATAAVRDAGGVPLIFNTIAVSDNQSQATLGMRASLVSREVIADSIELIVDAHDFDAVLCLVGCDKTVPAAITAPGRVSALSRRCGAMSGDFPALARGGAHSLAAGSPAHGAARCRNRASQRVPAPIRRDLAARRLRRPARLHERLLLGWVAGLDQAGLLELGVELGPEQDRHVREPQPNQEARKMITPASVP
jgi:hypothetical protein